ncbi:relaxase/mobilization nuclease domain-containing protein [Phenylobacterium aquaticum]|uniref:relaxase/mobilization nuclease domain-containing protein n=1 Tax=Phenylobacterium aquaticum TaxID=1763816 RepID=UPI001F5D10AC|nr:relaxase/mobilization nuclease domain-containing protein [Phenylobacterium aquaticum]MCI3135378.1 relaxase/mobilization nuclease domain-containing protein [Phenylobacterium aquaticum]
MREDWVAAARFDSQSRANSPLAHALTLSFVAMPQPERLEWAVRDLLQNELGGRFDYVFVRHDDTALPHVHVSIRSQGHGGARFHPTPQDLSRWRAGFAEALQRQGLAAEATPRWVRGAGRRSEPYYLFKLRQAWLEGGPVEPRIWRQAHRDAARLLARADPEPRPWEAQMRSRQARVAKAYGDWARELQADGSLENRRLGETLARFVAGLRAPESLRQSLARELEGAWQARQRTAERERDR